MGTANRDASRVTQRKRAVTMYSWNAANHTALEAGQSIRREQPNTQLGELLAYRNTTRAYSTPVDNSCPCSKEVVVSPSGANS